LTVDARNPNNKSLNENVEKTTNNINGFQIVGMDQMKQTSAVRVLRVKALSKKAIHYGLAAVLQENAVSYSGAMRFHSAGRLCWQ
jgi:hypothetical protein